jgi:hypothetical protein
VNDNSDRTNGARVEQTTDVLDLVRRHEPVVQDEWSELDQQRVLDQVFDNGRAPRAEFSRSRWVGFGLVATAAAAIPLAASIGLPTSAPGGPTPAAALDRLAVIAGVAGPTLGPGQYLHVQATNNAPYVADTALAPGEVRDGDLVRSTDETWTDQDEFWSRSVNESGQPCLESFPMQEEVDEGGYALASADELTTLSTDPDVLATYIDEHPDGGNRGTINRYAAVTDLLWSGLASPELRSAALDVLAQTPGLTGDAHTTDDLGRQAIRVDYRGDHDSESVWFDPATAQIIGRSYVVPGGTASSVVTAREAVDQLPVLPECTSRTP